jgi:hypothetical protein
VPTEKHRSGGPDFILPDSNIRSRIFGDAQAVLLTAGSRESGPGAGDFPKLQTPHNNPFGGRSAFDNVGIVTSIDSLPYSLVHSSIRMVEPDAEAPDETRKPTLRVSPGLSDQVFIGIFKPKFEYRAGSPVLAP